jgi:beta-lactamase class D
MNAKLTNSTIAYLENPWSGAVKTMTWGEIKAWAREHKHASDLNEWLKAAREAVKNGDAKTLGSMIIGS